MKIDFFLRAVAHHHVLVRNPQGVGYSGCYVRNLPSGGAVPGLGLGDVLVAWRAESAQVLEAAEAATAVHRHNVVCLPGITLEGSLQQPLLSCFVAALREPAITRLLRGFHAFLHKL